MRMGASPQPMIEHSYWVCKVPITLCGWYNRSDYFVVELLRVLPMYCISTLEKSSWTRWQNEKETSWQASATLRMSVASQAQRLSCWWTIHDKRKCGWISFHFVMTNCRLARIYNITNTSNDAAADTEQRGMSLLKWKLSFDIWVDFRKSGWRRERHHVAIISQSYQVCLDRWFIRRNRRGSFPGAWGRRRHP